MSTLSTRGKSEPFGLDRPLDCVNCVECHKWPLLLKMSLSMLRKFEINSWIEIGNPQLLKAEKEKQDNHRLCIYVSINNTPESLYTWKYQSNMVILKIASNRLPRNTQLISWNTHYWTIRIFIFIFVKFRAECPANSWPNLVNFVYIFSPFFLLGNYLKSCSHKRYKWALLGVTNCVVLSNSDLKSGILWVSEWGT